MVRQLGRAVTVLERFGLLGKVPVAGLVTTEIIPAGARVIDPVGAPITGTLPDPAYSG
jgi:hypothetical protein